MFLRVMKYCFKESLWLNNVFGSKDKTKNKIFTFLQGYLSPSSRKTCPGPSYLVTATRGEVILGEDIPEDGLLVSLGHYSFLLLCPPACPWKTQQRTV